MGMPILVYGKSGSGKSRSLKFFGEDEILLINIEGKELPFRSAFKYICRTDSLDTIITQIQKMPCKIAVIDDAGYLMTHHFMDNHRNKKGNASFDMYDDIADKMYFLIQRIKKETPEDMFEEPEIDNNLKLVDDTIRSFYGWSKKAKKKEDK